jgi:type II secretory pathway component PulF
MKQFRYKAYDDSGVLKQGEIPAVNLDSAKFKLKESGLIPVTVSDAQKSGSGLNGRFRIDFKPGLEQVEELTSRLALLLKNGIRVDSAFEFALKGVKNNRLKKAVEAVHEDIRKGAKLSDSLGKHPDIFDSLYISLVRVGEESGKLAQAFADIASSLSFHKAIMAKTRQALIYPLIIFFVCVGSILFIFNFIVPRFSVMFAGSDDLPAYTQLLLTMSDFFGKYQLVVFAVLTVGGLFLYSVRDHDAVTRLRHGLSARLPLVKKLCFTLENLRFASSLSMLLSSGVVLSDALDHAVSSVSNLFIRQRLGTIKQRVRQGEKLSTTLEDAGFLPDMFDGLVEVGEQTGNLAEVFKEMEARLRMDYENRITALITLIEPVMIIVMGLVVGSVVVGLLLSMVSVNDMVF